MNRAQGSMASEAGPGMRTAVIAALAAHAMMAFAAPTPVAPPFGCLSLGEAAQ